MNEFDFIDKLPHDYGTGGLQKQTAYAKKGLNFLYRNASLLGLVIAIGSVFL